MKLTYFQLEKQLGHKLLPVYLLSSDELVLKQECIDFIRQKAKAEGYSERRSLTLDAHFVWDDLYNELHSASLFALKRLIELDLTQALPNKIGGEILQLFADSPPPDTLLVVNMGKMNTKIAKSAWCASLEKLGALVTIWPLPHEQLPQWIMRRAKHYQLQMNLNVARILADFVEGNLVAAINALEKLSLMNESTVIDEQLIAAILIDESRYSIFDFVESAVGGDITRALHILEQLKAEGTEPILILWGLTREIRLMAELAEHKSKGHALSDLLQKQRIFAKRQIAITRFLAKYSLKDCWHLLVEASEIDKMMKGVKSGSPWDALQLFCLRMA